MPQNWNDKEPFYNYIIFLEKQIDLLERLFNNIEKIVIVGDCSNIRKYLLLVEKIYLIFRQKITLLIIIIKKH